MTSVGTGYDISSSTYSTEGRIYQVEYATQAANSFGTSIGMKVNNGVILGSVSRKISKLLKPASNKCISHVDKHIGIATTGWTADAREILNIARREAENYRSSYKIPPPTTQVVQRLGFYIHAHTLYSSVRPFGVNSIIGGKDDNGYHLHMIEPSGEHWGYRGCVVGKGQKEVKTELERIDLDNIDPTLAVNRMVKMLLKAHRDSEKEEPYHMEISWVTEETNGYHERVPQNIIDDAINQFENEGHEGEGEGADEAQETMEVE
ncbi:putative proteasome subunit alpha type-7 [Mycoemilia scoparia]|uniref:Proteasome subunit alpha type-7 n=1 Tax=Mycoemilia scoparia TaxID=417184 RepID=A0A9W8DTQ5_9FUNG|nr:putative proteasome subunit alpha type-7 [Mycoemilia scoparia]